MNVLFLTLLEFESINDSNIYTDLLREFIKNSHDVYVVSPSERKNGVGTHFVYEEKCTILRLKIGNTQKTNIIEKGISTVMIGPQVKAAIKKHFSLVKFDLVLYSTPPISFVSAIEFVKKRDGATSYLLLKDIFPQNAVDIGVLSVTGYRGKLYRYFRKQEKKLYSISNRIGCMSQANVEYIIKHNPEINPSIVEVCPNCIEVIDKSIKKEDRSSVRTKYSIPIDATVFVYGGNLGKPQGIPYAIECLSACKTIENAFFLIIGDGTDFSLMDSYAKKSSQKNLRVIQRLPKKDYDELIAACDVGLIFLDHRFTIPNFPSRILGYMQAKLPVIACTDPSTDVGKVIEEGEFGWKCESNNADLFRRIIDAACSIDMSPMKDNAWNYLKRYYSSDRGYRVIVENSWSV